MRDDEDRRDRDVWVSIGDALEARMVELKRERARAAREAADRIRRRERGAE